MFDQVKMIENLNEEKMEEAKQRVNSLIKPPGSLGQLEEIYVKLAGITGDLYPSVKERSIIVMSADHGVTEEGVSIAPSEITIAQTENMGKNVTGVCALAKQAGADLKIVDIGINGDIQNDKVINKKVKYGTNNFLKEKAMTREEAIKAIKIGIEIAEEEIKNGKELLGTGEMGIGNTTPSSAIVSVIAGVDPSEVTGMGAGLPEDKLSFKAEIIRKGIELHQPNPEDPIDILSKVGGLEIAGMAGVMLAGAANRVPVIVDGFISTAAALIAYKIEPKVVNYLFPSHMSEEKGAKIASEILGFEPPLNLNLRLGEGTGAAIMINIIEAATYMNNEMITFEEAGMEL